GIKDFSDLERLEIDPTPKQRAAIRRAVEHGAYFVKAWAKRFTSSKYGMATTHWSKLMDRVSRGVGNPCPLILIGMPASIIDMTA
ncbi:MAG: restriction endonuclease, partial [Parvibaculum sp.]